MSENAAGGATGHEDPPTLDRLAEDWIALWQSELAGLATDPDWMAMTQHAMAIGAGWLRFLAATGAPAASAHPAPAAEPPIHDPAADATSRSAPAAAASGHGGPAGLGGDASARHDGGLDVGAHSGAALHARIAELERRLASLERGSGGGGADRPGPRRRTPSA